VRAADSVVIGLDGGILVRPQHSHHVGLNRQLKQIVIMASVAAYGLAVSLEQLYPAVDSKHFLNKRPPEVQ
jgi:hypothetical protein